jgi:hypothetical protein
LKISSFSVYPIFGNTFSEKGSFKNNFSKAGLAFGALLAIFVGIIAM